MIEPPGLFCIIDLAYGPIRLFLTEFHGFNAVIIILGG